MSDQETWVSTTDRGVRQRMTVYYAADGVARVTRDALRKVLTLAGMRLSMDTTEDDAP